MLLSENIKKMRKEKGWTQKKLAIELNSHPTHINRIESSKYIPSLKLLVQMADLFEVTLDYLVNGKDEDLQEIRIEDKNLAEKLKLVDSLEDDEKQALMKIIDVMLTKKKFKEFMQKELMSS